ncbi:MAG: hypothetical protein ACI4EJ_10175 [Bacteroides sp.]
MRRHSISVTEYVIRNKYLLILYVGVIAGTFFANIFGRENINSWGLYNNEYLEMMTAVSFDYRQLFGYVALERAKLFGLMLLCGLTSVSTVCMLGFMLLGGFEFGIMVSMAVMQYGGAGVILVLVSLFPQWIFYIAAVMLMCRYCYGAKEKKTVKKEKAPATALMLVLIVAGVCTEVLLNPMLIKNLIYVIY